MATPKESIGSDPRDSLPGVGPGHGATIARPGSQDFAELPASAKHTVVAITAADGGRSRGILYEPQGRRPKTVVVWSHPSADLLQWWFAPYWVEAGYAAFAYGTRYMNNLFDCSHERCVLDVAGAVRYLREVAGFERVVLFGKSGGASLFAYYQAEATAAPGTRVAASPGGKGPNLNDHVLPPADGMIFAAGHPGQGKFLLGVIDPSVVDEHDPLATDPELDMYEPRNGFRQPPEVTRYDREWLDRYREGQRRRVARLDAMALSAVTEAATARSATQVAGFAALPQLHRQVLERRAEVPKILVIYRTEANPGYADLTIDSSDRLYGSIQSRRMDLHNYGLPGFARVLTAEAWLSTWSGISSYANLARNLPRIREPSYFVFPTGDEDIFPSQFGEQATICAAADKTVDWLPKYNHNLLLPGEASPDGARRRVMQLLVGWTAKRFPAS